MKATILYHHTKDILYVMQFFGHKNIKNTLKYTNLIEFGAEESYHVKVAKTVKEVCELTKEASNSSRKYKVPRS